MDDCTRFKCSLGLKRKSDVLEAFKQFKAYAENLYSRKLKAFRDNKGFEFMSNKFEQFCRNEGVERQHIVRNRPQQNGNAERANRTLSNLITGMLTEVNLPVQFWFHCLIALIYVLNRCPTASLKRQTPYEAWHRKKPDVSQVRIWRCLAYVHVQKDKRTSFGSYMEKCIFVGYLAGYKEWQFYNSASRRFIISERAEFNERYFLGIKTSFMDSILLSTIFNPVNSGNMPDLGERWCC